MRTYLFLFSTILLFSIYSCKKNETHLLSEFEQEILAGKGGIPGGNIAPPTNLAAISISPYSIVLNWNDNSKNETGFIVERTSDEGDFIEIATLNENTTTYTDTGLIEGKTYTYRIKAVKKGNGLAYSNESSATTPVDILSGLVAYFPFNGNPGDSSGNNNHGTVYNASLAEDRFGNLNSCYYFNGQNSYIKSASSISLNTVEENDAITITTWMKAIDYPRFVFDIVGKYNPNNDGGWELIYHTFWGFQFYYEYYALLNTTCTPVNNQTSWIHIAYTYDVKSEKYKFYINGILICEAQNDKSLPSTENGDLYIGFSPNGPDEYSHGYIDDLRIYNRALTAAQIKQLATY